MREVAVTGAGVVCPLGNDLGTFGRRMFAGESGVRDLRGSRYPADFPVPFGAVVGRDGLEMPGSSTTPISDDRLFAACATAQAVAVLPASAPVDAVVFGTTEGNDFETVCESFGRFPPGARAGTDGVAGEERRGGWAELRSEGPIETIAELLAERGHGTIEAARRIVVSTACASGNQALGLAVHGVRHGRWQRVVAGGVDTRLSLSNLMSHHLLSAVTVEERPPEQASRPFSIDRAGFVRGEGAASFVLESREAAVARGAEILALITGYGHTSDAYHFTEGRPDASAVAAAMAAAIRDAGLEPAAIDAISAHGTSTRVNDRLESIGIKRVFGERAYEVPITALKSQIGHSTMAAGAVEAVSCLLMLQAQRLAPTINYREDEIDPECDLDYVPNRSRPTRLRRMLSNSFGFGGHNACLVIESPPAGAAA